jgi:hypothetical protein
MAEIIAGLASSDAIVVTVLGAATSTRGVPYCVVRVFSLVPGVFRLSAKNDFDHIPLFYTVYSTHFDRQKTFV